jgi:hypothetical protein
MQNVSRKNSNICEFFLIGGKNENEKGQINIK